MALASFVSFCDTRPAEGGVKAHVTVWGGVALAERTMLLILGAAGRQRKFENRGLNHKNFPGNFIVAHGAWCAQHWF